METDYFNVLKENGIHWLPSTKEKKPALSSYKEYFTTVPSEQTYKAWSEGIQNGRHDGIQVINGKVSNNLFTLSFDFDFYIKVSHFCLNTFLNEVMNVISMRRGRDPCL